MRKVKLVIIGAGTAGLAARREAARHTDDYLLVDPGILGTTCARVGCMPSKVLIQIAEDYHRRLVLPQMGISGELHVDGVKVLEHVRQLRDRFVRSVLEDMDHWTPKHLIRKRARFLDLHTLDLEGDRIEAERIIIATGSAPIVPEPWQKYRSYLTDTDQFFESTSLPRSLAVIGLGIIGLEIGQSLHRLGVKVTGLGQGRSLGGLTDPVLLQYAWNTLGREFPLHEGTVTELMEEHGQLQLENAEGKRFKVDQALVAIGRRPRLEGLGLKECGVPLNDKGIPIFNPSTLEIGETRVFIAGDVNGHRAVLHEAADEGRIAAYNALRDKSLCMKRRVPLTITFSSPQIALVGQSFKELTAHKVDFVRGEQSFEGQGRAIVKHMEMGRIHVYVTPQEGRLLGAEMFCPDAEHLAHLLAWSISSGHCLKDMLSFPIYHPVLEEGLRSALRKAAQLIKDKPDPIELMRCDTPMTAQLS